MQDGTRSVGTTSSSVCSASAPPCLESFFRQRGSDGLNLQTASADKFQPALRLQREGARAPVMWAVKSAGSV